MGEGEDTTVYLLNRMNAFRLDHVLLWQKDTNTNDKHDAETIKWLNPLLVASSMDELNIQSNENFDLLTTLEKFVIVRLMLIFDDIFLCLRQLSKP